MSSRKNKVYARSVEGLRDALFDELEDLREGASSPHEAVAFSTLAERVLDTFDKEMKKAAFDMAVKERAQRLEELKVALLEQKPIIDTTNIGISEYEEELDDDQITL
jgi:hypothetical protein